MAKIPFVDTHVHFYDLRRKDLVYEWLQPEFVHPQLGDINAIKTLVYDATSFHAESRFANVSKVVHVQAALGAPDPVAETIWLDEMFQREGGPDAMIAAANLSDPSVQQILERHVAASSRVCGIRDFGDGDYLSSTEWQRGYALLEQFDLICDLDCTWENMGKARDVARRFPATFMVLEHVGYPSSRSEEYFRDWRRGLAELASAENTWCKISGLGMYDHDWTVESIRPWVVACLEIFGVERCFFGSNWPVDRLFSSYDVVINAYAEIVKDLSEGEQEALFFANATKVYGLG
ncbi:MAG TPA: amidohydrolase family protein [Acidimicrobiales bacterium]|nr:amidohydrolase family protein [Acidimicrobiales bacterium]